MMSARSALVPPPRSVATDPVDARFSSPYVRALCEALRLFGHDSGRFLARVGIDPDRLSQDWFTLAELDALFVEALATTGDPAFGLHWAERSPMMQFDLGPSLFASAPSLRHGLEAVILLQLLFATRAQCSLVEEGSRATLTFDLIAASDAGRQLLTELTLVSVRRGFRYLGQLAAIRRINVSYPRPAHGSEYERVFGPTLHFDQPRTSIEFASSALDRPSVETSEPLHRKLLEHTDEVRDRLPHGQSFCAKVERYVRLALPSVPSVIDTAATMGLSARSLRRRLEEEQSSFSELVDRAQRERAFDLLGRASMSIKRVAHEAGFQSTSGFHRAYKRWTGTSPARHRATRD